MTVIASGGSLLALGRSGALSTPSWPGSWSYMPNLDDRRKDALGSYQHIYRTQPEVQTVVSFLARNVAQIGLHAFRRRSRTDRDRLDATHELVRLLLRPSPDHSHFTYLEALMVDRKVFGEHFALKVRNPATGDLELWRVPPQNVALGEGGTWLRAESFVIESNRGKREVPAAAVFHLKTHNPDDPRVGLSPLEALRRILIEGEQAGRYRENYWRNAARIEGVLAAGKKMSAPAMSRLQADWERLNTGEAASGRTAILEEGMEFKPISFNARESQYIESRKLAREEVAAVYHVQPAMVGILEHANFANIREQHQMLYQDTLGPDLVAIEEELERQVLPEIADTDDVYVEFNIKEKLRGSFTEEAQAMQTAVGAAWMTRNEARARENLPPVDEGDEVITPLNVLIGGQASPTDSAPKAAENGHKAEGVRV